MTLTTLNNVNAPQVYHFYCIWSVRRPINFLESATKHRTINSINISLCVLRYLNNKCHISAIRRNATVHLKRSTTIYNNTCNLAAEDSPRPYWFPCSSICIMDLPILRTIPFLDVNGLIRQQANPCWHTNGLWRTSCMLACGHHGWPPARDTRQDGGRTMGKLISWIHNAYDAVACGGIRCIWLQVHRKYKNRIFSIYFALATRSSGVAKRPRDASCHWIFRQVTHDHARPPWHHSVGHVLVPNRISLYFVPFLRYSASSTAWRWSVG